MQSNQDLKEGYQHGLRLRWCLGMNHDIPNSVFNLTDKHKSEIFYVSGHTAVLYDYKKKRQKLLQGHCNRITAVAYSRKKEIIVTADTGEGNLLVVWSEHFLSPLKTIFEPDEVGIRCIDISPDGEQILTLGQPKDGYQMIKVWLWGDRSQDAILYSVKAYIDKSECPYDYIRWNTVDMSEFVTTGRRLIRFWHINNDAIYGYTPAKKEDREFTQTIFIPENHGAQAVTGTSNGHLIVWDTILILEEFASVNNRREVKSINLLTASNKKYGDKKTSISLLNIYNDMIIVGTSAGTVRFYDFRFRIICWFEETDMGSIQSLSFSNLPVDEDKDDEDLSFPEFIVCDSEASINMLCAQNFREIEVSKKQAKSVFKSIKSPVLWTSMNSNSTLLAFATADGKVFEWELWSEEPKLLRDFGSEQNHEIATVCEYSPDGKYLIAGTNQGHLYVKTDTMSVSPLLISHKKKGVIVEKLVFSSCSKYLAAADNYKCVTLFKLGYKYEDKNLPIEWVFSGKVRAHTAPITDVCFIDPGPRLFSIGQDMTITQYNVEKSKDFLIVECCDKIESTEYPTAVAPYPFDTNNEHLLLTANTGYKLKLWSSKICRQTVLGPCFGGPITILRNLNPKKKSNKYKYVAYATADKVIGIIRLPLDGNPHNYIGLIAVPGRLNHMSISPNGKYISTAGEGDLNIWRVDYDILEQNEMFNVAIENPLDIYPSLLEGGEDGELYRELKDFFYYSQIRRMEENSTKAHKLDGKIPLKEIPNLMIALGHYPTLKEMENMQNEVKYSKADKGIFVEDLALKDFVKLFINHRSAYGLTKEYIEDTMREAFDDISQISRKDLVELLTKHGEKMSLEEINYYLNVLVGEGDVDNLLNENTTAEHLITNVLGFETNDQAETEE